MDQDQDFNESQETEPAIEIMSPVGRVRLHFHVSNTLHKDLADIAVTEETSVAAVARRAIVRFIRAYKTTGNF